MKYASQKANFHTLEREDDDGIYGGIGTTVDKIIEGTLRRYFCYQNFKPLQRDIIKATQSWKNVLGTLGPGSGKSLTFLLPAVLSSTPTFVVEPTTALTLHRANLLVLQQKNTRNLSWKILVPTKLFLLHQKWLREALWIR